MLVAFSTAGLIAAHGYAIGATPSATQPFEVCSPLGCAQQRVAGTVSVRPGTTRLDATATDNARTSQLTGQLQLIDASGVIYTRSFTVDDKTITIGTTIARTAVTLRVSACAVPPGTCNTRTIPLG